MDFLTLSFMAENIRILVIGGGEAGFMKAKTLQKRGAHVTVISKEFIDKFRELEESQKVTLIKGEYKKKCIHDKHFVVIALGEIEKIEEIKRDCEENNKLFLTCHNFKEGNFLVPFQEETKEMVMSLHTKKGNPLVSRFVMNRLSYEAQDMDGFIGFSNNIRDKYKKGLIDKSSLYFVASEDFYYFFKKGKGGRVLEMFYSINDNEEGKD